MNTEQAPRPANDEIDLRDLMAAIAKGKWIILATTTLFTVLAVLYTLSLPNIYKSEVLLAPVYDDKALSIPGQLGGLAALAGVSLGGKGGDKTALALEILKSREFLGAFVEKNDLLLELMGVEGWDRSANKLVINPKMFNERTNEWIRKVEEPFRPKPSIQEGVEALNKIFEVTQDKTSGMIKLSIVHYSPYHAKYWLDQLVISINDEMKERELNDAEASIKYLNNRLRDTNVAEMRSMLYSLIQEQSKIIMLANVRAEYIFSTVDKAEVPEKKFKPNRVAIVLTVFLSSLIIATMISVLLNIKSRA